MVSPHIDLVVLSRDESALADEVQRGIAAQADARLTIHRVTGPSRPDDANRWQTIARARNEGKTKGSSDWLMFLDDDVQLAPGCVRRLWDELQSRPAFAALAADYLGESRTDIPARHVGMGATLFRRAALRDIHFRWRPGRCECQCCCDDLRRNGYGIDYCPVAQAWHLTSPASHPIPGSPAPENAMAEELTVAGRVLAAFDRAHYHKFKRQFLASLRISGNDEVVTAVAYGLYPSQQRELARQPGVELLSLADNGVSPAIRRLLDFQSVLADWPEDTPVAYWDAGDVIFQDRLEKLWKTVREHPERLLAVEEPLSHPENRSVAEWTLSIQPEHARNRAFKLLSAHPILNSGFAAGTARVLTTYLAAAHQLRHSDDMRGTTDWGDQTALNLYCYRQPNSFLATDEGWNYCLFGRQPDEVFVAPDGRINNKYGTPICVVHGNARTLRRLSRSWRVRKRVPSFLG
jgi:hypothetical protein